MEENLAYLKIRHNFSLAGVSEVAALIITLGVKIPVDARTICQTDCRKQTDPNFVYLGIEGEIHTLMRKSTFQLNNCNAKVVEVQFVVDLVQK